MEITQADSLETAVRSLAALAQTHRLSVYRALVQAGHGGLAAGAIAERLAIPRSSLSFHLSALKQGGLIAERREGRSIIYTADFAAMRSLIAFLMHNCCAGDTLAPELIEQFANRRLVMKRFHVNLRVADLEASTHFYTEMFGAQPTVSEPDYRKWMLDDPRINFSIEPRVEDESATGVAHLGVQVSDEAELEEMRARIGKADSPAFHEGETQCCYAHSFKSWTRDPDGLVWETFFTDGQRRDYGSLPQLAETME